MPNELPIPPELQHLIEKREGEDRRRADEADEPALAEPEADETVDPTPLVERRRKQGRRNDDG